jgi:hypothetical protein
VCTLKSSRQRGPPALPPVLLQAQYAGNSIAQGTITQLHLADNEAAQAVLPELQVRFALWHYPLCSMWLKV